MSKDKRLEEIRNEVELEYQMYGKESPTDGKIQFLLSVIDRLKEEAHTRFINYGDEIAERNDKIRSLEAENKELKKQIQYEGMENYGLDMKNKALSSGLKEAEKALQFYADDITWTDGEGGEVAGEALEKLRNKDND